MSRRISVLYPPIAFERQGSEREQVHVSLDTVPVIAMNAPYDHGVFFFADLPSSDIVGDDEAVLVAVVNQVAME